MKSLAGERGLPLNATVIAGSFLYLRASAARLIWCPQFIDLQIRRLPRVAGAEVEFEDGFAEFEGGGGGLEVDFGLAGAGDA